MRLRGLWGKLCCVGFICVIVLSPAGPSQTAQGALTSLPGRNDGNHFVPSREPAPRPALWIDREVDGVTGTASLCSVCDDKIQEDMFVVRSATEASGDKSSHK
ncbi:unnamed protein product [Merluccius merluccius]